MGYEQERLIDGVTIESHDMPLAWAVFTGTEGEDATMRAIFVSKEDADAYVAANTADPDADSWLCDPQVVPCAVKGTLLVSNHYSDDEGVAALAKAI